MTRSLTRVLLTSFVRPSFFRKVVRSGGKRPPTSFRWGCICQCRAFSARVMESEDEEGLTHFGYTKIKEEDKTKKVYQVFENVADKYDLMNDLMSGGIHRLWKSYFVNQLSPRPDFKLLDVAGGTGDCLIFKSQEVGEDGEVKFINATTVTNFLLQNLYHFNVFAIGDIALRYIDALLKLKRKKRHFPEESPNVVVCDINREMLRVGKQRAKLKGLSKAISWEEGDAENLPFEDDTFDIYTIAFGIRNVTHIEKALDEAFRVLKPGGKFACLEFSDVSFPLVKSIYDSYSFQVIPVLGKLVADDWKSYQYLVESIRQFPCQDDFADIIENAGFCQVAYENLTLGVAAIHTGFKL